MPIESQKGVKDFLKDFICYLNYDERRRLVASLHDTITWTGVHPRDGCNYKKFIKLQIYYVP